MKPIRKDLVRSAPVPSAQEELPKAVRALAWSATLLAAVTLGCGGHANGVPASTATLTVVKAGDGSGLVSGRAIQCGTTCVQESLAAGTRVSLSATAANGSTFVAWTGGGCSGTGDCNFDISSDTTVTATFALTQPGNNINAASCALADVQAAVAQATNGDAVNVPAGACTWGDGGTGLDLNKAITIRGAGRGNTVITISDTAPGGWTIGIFQLSAAATVKALTVQTLVSAGSGTAFSTSADGFRISDVEFIGRATNINGYFLYAGSYGLVDGCEITGGAGNNELIYVRGPIDSWQTPSTLGGAQNLFIEDCTFGGEGYVIDSNANSRTVLRFNTVTGPMKIDAHDRYFDTPKHSSRHVEVYGNTWTSSASYWAAIELRGGTGRVFSNTATATSSEAWFVLNANEALYGNTPTYPIDDQIGVGQDPKVGGSEPMYFWSNRAAGQMWLSGLGYGTSDVLSTFIQADRDYYEEVPSFNGSSGVGVGTGAQMRAITPTKKGVGFWVTNEGDWNAHASGPDGAFYVWNGSAWELDYTPFPYPHPRR